MKLFAPKEPGSEMRCSLIPADVRKLTTLGAQVLVERGVGHSSGYSDDEYAQAGATVTDDRAGSLSQADAVLRLRKPPLQEVSQMKRGAMHVSFLDPFNEKELIQAMASAGVSGVSMEMMPRSTLAQKMDAISSQANLAGYAAVIRAAERLNRILPMMMTPAGTLSPARFFIIGVGVAGLQAIATAKRLGARVEAFDTRPVVEEQVKSLGAKFVKIDLGETGQTEQGYAKELTPEQIELQRQGMAKVCGYSDVVITTAKLFGRKAPVIVTRQMVEVMRPNSIIVDLAAETGGNCELTRPGEEYVTDNGVAIIGDRRLEASVPHHASQMYSANVTNFLEHFWDKEAGAFGMKTDDEIIKSCLITHDGAIVNERFK